MIKRIASKETLLMQAERLKTRRFTPGFDKMTADAAAMWIELNATRLTRDITQGDYHPMPAVGFRSAKRSGSYRQFVRLTALDTIIQKAIIDAVSDVVESRFSDFSFAYRRERGVESALQQYCEYSNKYSCAAKLDPCACFDNIDHSVLHAALSEAIDQPEVVELIMQYVRMPVMLDGELIRPEKGILQGVPLSGMLCNIYFDSMDKHLLSLGIPFIRYADDIVIFAAYMSEIRKYAETVERYMSEKLGLKKNENKFVIDSPLNIKYLGHKFDIDRRGIVVLEADMPMNTAYYNWHRSEPENNHRRVSVLSDGILRQRDYSLLFESDGDCTNIPIETTDVINIYSDVIFDSGFLQRAMTKGVTINVFGKNNKLIGSFLPNSPLRSSRVTHEQLMVYYDPVRRLELARAFVLASIHNLRLNIRYYNKQEPSSVYDGALRRIDKAYKAIKQCESYEELLVLEAQVRREYYGCFDSFIGIEGFSFERRTRRPPQNEINAMISFGNTVLYNLLATELNKSPLDVRVGFLHATNRRTESLNLDIAEIFKPLVIDRVVFSLVNRRIIKKEHFEASENDGVYLTQEGKRIFLQMFYEKMETVVTVKDRKMNYNQIVTEELQKLVRYFKSGEKYIPFKQVR